MVSVVVTSCGRFDLLHRTLRSFYKFNTYPIEELIIIEDSFDNKGQIVRIDEAYSRVKTPYIFHLEDDWEFTHGGFIEKSLEILKDPLVMQVWLMKPHDTPTDKGGDNYKLVGTNFFGWHGFTLNPGLRRLSDYKLVAPYSQFGNTGLAEQAIGQRYYELGFRGAVLNKTYIKHIGNGRHC